MVNTWKENIFIILTPNFLLELLLNFALYVLNQEKKMCQIVPPYSNKKIYV